VTLCVVSLKLFFTDGAAFVTTGGFGRQMDALAASFDRVDLCVPVARGIPAGSYAMAAPNVRIRPLPAYRTQSQFLLAAPRIAARVLRAVAGADIVCARMPDLTGWLGFAAARVARKPVFITLVGDWAEVILVRDATGAKGLARRALRLYVHAYEALERRAVRHTLTFAGGRALCWKHRAASKIRAAVWTTVSERDVAPFRDTCAGGRARLLFVGRLTRAKGLSHLMETVAELHASGLPVTLDIVGDGELRAAVAADIALRGLGGVVTLRGTLPHGGELRAAYDAADALVLPSVSEGTPKVLLEAMARCLPVIATDVGGVSSVVGNEVNGLLVPPERPSELAAAVRRVVENGELRRLIIEGGRATALRHTIERETGRMVDSVRAEFPRLWDGTRP